MASEDRDFIQKFCIDAIRLKKQERVTKAVKNGGSTAEEEERDNDSEKVVVVGAEKDVDEEESKERAA